jgi:hypothetical protein
LNDSCHGISISVMSHCAGFFRLYIVDDVNKNNYPVARSGQVIDTSSEITDCRYLSILESLGEERTVSISDSASRW